MAGTFAPSDQLRALAFGLDGTGLVVGAAPLAVHHLRLGQELLAAGFLVFLAGETLIVSGSAMELAASAPTFAAGVAFWSAGSTDAAVEAPAIFRLSIPGAHAIRLGVGARQEPGLARVINDVSDGRTECLTLQHNKTC